VRSNRAIANVLWSTCISGAAVAISHSAATGLNTPTGWLSNKHACCSINNDAFCEENRITDHDVTSSVQGKMLDCSAGKE